MRISVSPWVSEDPTSPNKLVRSRLQTVRLELEQNHLTEFGDNFVTILRAVSEGRSIFTNIQKFTLHLLSGNVSEVIALIIGLALRDIENKAILPMSSIQILWLNMVTSSPIALALGNA